MNGNGGRDKDIKNIYLFELYILETEALGQSFHRSEEKQHFSHSGALEILTFLFSFFFNFSAPQRLIFIVPEMDVHFDKIKTLFSSCL